MSQVHSGDGELHVQAMFYGSSPQTDDVIKMPDVTPTAFRNMLRYAYGYDVQLDGGCLEDALDTLYCAKKFLIAKLARNCRDHLQLHAAFLCDDPCRILQMVGASLDEEDLISLALQRIAVYADGVMAGDELLGLSFDSLKRIVEYPHLHAEEANIYKGVRRWIERNVGAVSGTLRDAFSSLLYSIRFPLFTAAELANGPITDGVLTGDEIGRLVQFLFGDVKPALPFLTAPRSSLEEPCEYFFKLVTAPTDAVLGPFSDNVLQLSAFGYLAPACCAFLEHLVDERRHIRIASFGNEHVGRTLPLPAAVAEERNVLSHTIKGACWFEWDMEGGVARDIRIGSGSKPSVYHSAVFGLVSGFSTYESNEMVMFDRWDDRRIQKITNFRFL